MTVLINSNNNKLLTHNGKLLIAPEQQIGIPRVVENGVYKQPTTYSLPIEITELGDYGLSYGFHYDASLTSIDLSSLTTISGYRALDNCFFYCTALTSIDLSSLITVSGNYAMDDAFNGCRGATFIDLSSLTTVSGNGAMFYAFSECIAVTSINLSSLKTISGIDGLYSCFSIGSSTRNYLTSISFPALDTLTGIYALRECFAYRTALTSISFPALTSTSFGSDTTTQFRDMLYGITGCTVHFPSNLQSVIGSWNDVTAGFGGTNTTVLFDLTATS